jgi:hypothetical protein
MELLFASLFAVFLTMSIAAKINNKNLKKDN